MKFSLINFFKNKILYQQAFIHRSYLNEHKNFNLKSNERLEFLGDAVLELIVSLYLFNKYPDYPEGKLTAIRAKFVQTQTLSLAAQRLDLGNNLKLSKGEKNANGNQNPSTLANTFEALIGAIYQDQGFDKTYDFVLNNLLKPAQKLFADKLPKDYKSHLQEFVQSQGKKTPKYKVVESLGPDHNKTFKVAVLVKSNKIAEGTGKSKQQAEQQAAKTALAILRTKT